MDAEKRTVNAPGVVFMHLQHDLTPLGFVCFGFIVPCLVDASAAMQVRALKDYCNNYDLTSLNIKAGDIITVQRSNDCPKIYYIF